MGLFVFDCLLSLYVGASLSCLACCLLCPALLLVLPPVSSLPCLVPPWCLLAVFCLLFWGFLGGDQLSDVAVAHWLHPYILVLRALCCPFEGWVCLCTCLHCRAWQDRMSFFGYIHTFLSICASVGPFMLNLAHQLPFYGWVFSCWHIRGAVPCRLGRSFIWLLFPLSANCLRLCESF